MYKLKVTIAQLELELVWDKGKLSGDELAVNILLDAAGFDQVIGPSAGPNWNTSSSVPAEGTPTFLLAKRVFDEVEVVEGELPPIPIPPDSLDFQVIN